MAKRARSKSGWGGRREGAGRPPSRPRASERHETRPPIAATHAIHVTARVTDDVGTALRRQGGRAAHDTRGTSRHAIRNAIRNAIQHAIHGALERAVDLSLERSDFRIVHLGVRVDARDTRLELIVEARDRLALARGMQGFQISAARSLNRAVRRTGSVFADRYRARVLATRPAVQRAIASLPPRTQRISMPASSPLLD